jgi:hypothetical protein
MNHPHSIRLAPVNWGCQKDTALHKWYRCKLWLRILSKRMSSHSSFSCAMFEEMFGPKNISPNYT